MRFDHLAEEQGTRRFTSWVRLWMRDSPEQLAATLAAKHRDGEPVTASYCSTGRFNVCFRVCFDDGSYAIVRFASLGRCRFRQEKVDNEVATMRYLRQNTSIRVPEILGAGRCGAGPYIVMTYVKGSRLSDYLRDPLKKESPVLNPHIGSHLKRAYRGMAQIVLELSKLTFSRIGALALDEMGTWTVTRRPMTFNMNELIERANYPPEEYFVTSPVEDAADYFEALATYQLCHLISQRNDAVTDEADCRKKYMARCLFRNIAHEVSKEHRHGLFRLFCDDLRPSNVLIGDTTLKVAAVIDWEFAYVAPAEFTYSAPWWLLLQGPKEWESDLKQFLARYTPRLAVFLDALRECEAEEIKAGTLLASQCLSERMARTMENGFFWIFQRRDIAFCSMKYTGGFLMRCILGP